MGSTAPLSSVVSDAISVYDGPVPAARKGDAVVSAETKSVIERARKIYAAGLQQELKAHHRDRFVAIEPESGEHFLGDTFDEAVNAAAERYPNRLSYTIHVGHRAAFHIGGWQP
jgi:DNA-binding transcriptional regulator YdaS (Cro superfamily)